ncbi:hypothetical protein JW960_23530 [candidate division KSB1 bacterium]|nr:hypothetical protein [candidate division KSB1 bacterium]
MRKLLIIDKADYRTCELFIRELPEETLLYTMITIDDFDRARLNEYITKCGIKHHLLNITGKVDKFGYELRYKYINYLDALRYHPAMINRTVEGKVGYYWLTEMSTHRSDLYGTFIKYIHIHIILHAIQENQIDACFLVSENINFIDSLRRSLASYRIDFNTTKTSVPDYWTIKSWLRDFYFQLIWAFRTSTFGLYLKSAISIKSKLEELNWGVYSVFPHLWRGSKLQDDDKYRGIIEKQKPNNESSAYLISMVSDGYIQNMRIAELIRCYRANRTVLDRHVMIDKFSTLYDVFKFTMQAIYYIVIGHWMNYLLNRKRITDDNGVDITAFLMEQNHVSYLRIPRILWEARKIERCLRICSIKKFVYYLYEWTLGRAINARIKLSNQNILTIGMQHGPINKRRLYNVHHPERLKFQQDTDYCHHMPHPDELWVEDQQALETLLESGYPKSAIKIIQSQRKVKSIIRESRSADYNEFRVVIYPTLWDVKPVLDFLLEFLNTREQNIKVFIKPHPRSTFTIENIQHYINEHHIRNLEIIHGTMEEALAMTDLAIGTISSALEEAANCRIPVALISMVERYNESSLFDRNDVTVIQSDDEFATFVAQTRYVYELNN